MQELGQENSYPNVKLNAHVSPDAARITVIFPDEFINASVAFTVDHYGRHRVIMDPMYGGQTVIGFVDSQGVKHGKVELNPATIGLKNLVPGKMGYWSAKQREDDLLIGKLLTDLCRDEKPSAPPEPRIEVKEIVVEKPFTIEGALNFINQWAKENRAELIVEDGMLFAEVRKRIGPPPPAILTKKEDEK